MKKILFTLVMIGCALYVFSAKSSYNNFNRINNELSPAVELLTGNTMFPPTLVSPVNGATGQMPDAFLKWSAVPSAFHYKVQVSTDSLFGTAKTYSTNLAAVNADHLLFNTTYFWRVKAYGVSDSSAWSDPNKFTVLEKVTVTTPANGSICSSVRVFIKWDSISGLSKLEYEIDTSLSFSSPYYVTNGVAPSKSKTFSKELAFGTNYYLRMRAMHSSDTSVWSDPVSFSTFNKIKMSLKDSIDVSPIELLIWNWAGSGNYEYALATDTSFSDAVYVNVDTTYTVIFTASPGDTLIQIHTDTLHFGTTYYCKVRGMNNYGISDWSDYKKFNTINLMTIVAPAIGATDVNRKPTFTWKKIDNINYYNLELDVDSNFTNPTSFIYGNTGITTTLTSDLQWNTKYFWRMRALTYVDTTEWCTPFYFKTKVTDGIEDNLSNSNISIYPNPSTNGKVNISIPASDNQQIALSIVNMVGQEIFTDLLQLKSGNNLYTVNLHDYNNGIYFIRLQGNGNVISRKIILNK